MQTIDWSTTLAAIWRPQRAYLRPVRHPDPVTLDTLVGIDQQKAALRRNTERFLAGKPANNALLWGARGTGKSSLVKALLNACGGQGLRLIQVDKEDLLHLAEIVDELRDLPQHFIIFCDDLSFEAEQRGYKGIKSVLEGSIELPPRNILLYATSNRRHLLPEKISDNQSAQVAPGELHYGDAVEEKLSLSDRFGLALSFYQGTLDDYLRIVDSYFSGYHGDRTKLYEQARLFAAARGSRSGRTAKQFYNWFVEEE